jgi:hypothetical protein
MTKHIFDSDTCNEVRKMAKNGSEHEMVIHCSTPGRISTRIVVSEMT